MTEKPQIAAVGQARFAVPRRQIRADAPVGHVENRVGEVRELLRDFGERGRAEHVAQRDAQQLPAPEAAPGSAVGMSREQAARYSSAESTR